MANLSTLPLANALLASQKELEALTLASPCVISYYFDALNFLLRIVNW